MEIQFQGINTKIIVAVSLDKKDYLAPVWAAVHIMAEGFRIAATTCLYNNKCAFEVVSQSEGSFDSRMAQNSTKATTRFNAGPIPRRVDSQSPDEMMGEPVVPGRFAGLGA